MRRWDQPNKLILSLIILLAMIILSSTRSAFANARWVWVKGVHQQGKCNTQRSVLESALTQSLIELAQINLVYDGQVLSCKDTNCARARLASSGGMMALLGESTCLRNQLRYTVQVVSLSASLKSLVYRRSLTVQTDAEAIQVGQWLAYKILRGPKPLPLQEVDQPKATWGLTLGFNWSQLAYDDTLGSAFAFHRTQQFNAQTSIESRFGIAGMKLLTDELELNEVKVDGGIVWNLSKTGFGLTLSGGMSLAYYMQASIERTVKPLDDQGQFWVSRKDLNVNDGLGVAPWFEMGWVWMTGRLQPQVIFRYTPFKLWSGESWSDVTLQFGFRWR